MPLARTRLISSPRGWKLYAVPRHGDEFGVLRGAAAPVFLEGLVIADKKD